MEEATMDSLLHELSRLTTSENETVSHLEMIDDGMLEVICDMLEIISSTSLRRHSALMKMKERALPLMGDVNRELIFVKWQIKMELDAVKQMIIENQRKISLHLRKRCYAVTESVASKKLRRK